MRKLLIAALSAGLAAAQTGTGSSPAGGQSSQGATGAVTAQRTNAAATSETFTDAVADDLLFQLADGMESRNPRLTLGAFDPAKVAGYERFSGQVGAWLRDHSSFRVYYKLRQTSFDSGRGSALVDFQYEAQPRTEGALPVRRHEQLRFTFERGARGWKIVDVSPRNFFS